MVRQDEANIKRFNRWFKQASKEQFLSFWLICVGSIVIFSVLAYSTVYGQDIAEEADFDFIEAQGVVLKDVVAPWFGTFFWIFGSLSLALVALGVVDYVSRLVADVVKTLYARENERWSESKIYFLVVWSMVTFGIRDPALRLRRAARAARALRVPERHRDVHLLDPAHPPQSQVTAHRDQGQGLPARHAVLRGRLLWLLRGLARDRADRRQLLAA